MTLFKFNDIIKIGDSMNAVEFNGNEIITLESICEFLIYKVIEATDTNAFLKNFKTNETIQKIKTR